MKPQLVGDWWRRGSKRGAAHEWEQWFYAKETDGRWPPIYFIENWHGDGDLSTWHIVRRENAGVLADVQFGPYSSVDAAKAAYLILAHSGALT